MDTDLNILNGCFFGQLDYLIPRCIYRSVPLIRPLRKYALPLFFAQVPAQGSLTRYNAPLVNVERLLEYLNYTCATLQIVSQMIE